MLYCDTKLSEIKELMKKDQTLNELRSIAYDRFGINSKYMTKKSLIYKITTAINNEDCHNIIVDLIKNKK